MDLFTFIAKGLECSPAVCINADDPCGSFDPTQEHFYIWEWGGKFYMCCDVENYNSMDDPEEFESFEDLWKVFYGIMENGFMG